MTSETTVFESVQSSLQRASDFNQDDTVPPACILWPDEKRDWEKLIPRFRAIMPHFLTLGSYTPDQRSGPAIWLRCVLAGKVTGIEFPKNTVPIIYLPGVSRATLRATEECPNELKPMAELQYRGVIWSQANGKDWTLSAYLQNEKGGLGLTVARDQGTGTSLRRAIEKLADISIQDLKAKSLTGELNGTYLDSLISDDLVDDLLTWMARPKEARTNWLQGRWETLCSRCIADYGFDPDRDGDLVAAEKLGLQSKLVWKTIWKRFAASPTSYQEIEILLRKAKPQPKGHPSLFSHAEEYWPQDNDQQENELRLILLDLTKSPVAEARQVLQSLEQTHGHRRDWVWAKLGQAPLAFAIGHLASMATRTETQLTGGTLSNMVKAFTEEGWKTDAAVLDALGAVNKTPDVEAISTAIAHIYKPWLRDAAELFQERVRQTPIPGREQARLPEISTGTCVLFVDGLRYDLGRKLLERLSSRGHEVQSGHHFVALPSVTATSKPAVSPVTSKISGTTSGEEFRASVLQDGKDLTPDRFRRLLADDGIQYLGSHEAGDPSGKAWTEFGNLDSTGHNEGSGMARRIPELITTLVERIESLLEAGWKEMKVVTDHGWLLMPKGLPKSDLPKYLTETRWRRCAVVKPNADVSLPTFPWFWADDVRISCPPGIDCFLAGEEYSHGGLSLQECVVPQFSISAAVKVQLVANIDSFKWSGLRCKVKVVGSYEGCSVDLRDKLGDASSSLTNLKPVLKDGTASLMVENDSREGTASFLVLLDPQGNILDKTHITVGE